MDIGYRSPTHFTWPRKKSHSVPNAVSEVAKAEVLFVSLKVLGMTSPTAQGITSKMDIHDSLNILKQGKTGNLEVHFSRQVNTGNFPENITKMFYTGNLPPTQGKFRVKK